MKSFHFTKAVNLPKLCGELIAAIPALTPVDGVSVFSLRGNDTECWLDAPGTVDEAAIQAVIDAHDPTPVPVPDPDEELWTAINSATTLDELKAALTKGKGARVEGRKPPPGQIE